MGPRGGDVQYNCWMKRGSKNCGVKKFVGSAVFGMLKGFKHGLKGSKTLGMKVGSIV